MLPQAVNTIKKRESQLLQIHGLNLSDNISPGDMVDSSNISAHRFPYISTRLPREKSEEYVNVTGLAAHSELVVIEGTDVYYGGELVEGLTVTAGEKQIVAINTKICIFPDKKYFNINLDGTPGEWYNLIPDNIFFTYHDFLDVGSIMYGWYGSNYDRTQTYMKFRAYTGTGTFAHPSSQYDTTYDVGLITEESVAYLRSLNKQFESFGEVKRKYSLSASYDAGSGYSAGSFTAYSTSKPYYYSYTENKSGDTVLGACIEIMFQDCEGISIPLGVTTNLSFGSIKAESTSGFPDLDYVCVHNNRVYGCCNSDQTIRASAQGDPMVWDYMESGSAAESYAVAVASPGNFTGCCAYSSSVLFFKADTLHKLLGDYPAEYMIYQYDIEGVKEGAYKSMVTINETLYYMGIHGVYRYNGSTPQLISANFGNTDFQDAIAGTDGDTYYLSVKLGNTPYLLAYETRYGLWILEDHIRAIGFARLGRELYFADTDGNLWHMNSGTESNMEWSVTFAPMCEWVTSAKATGKDGHKVYSRICLNVELAKGSYIVVSVSCDGKPYESTGAIVGSVEGWREIRIPINRCNKFQLKLSGKGKMAILSILREYATRSSV